MCKLIRQKHRNSHIMYLSGVAIHPDYFGKGFGKKMMLEIINICKIKSVSRVELSVDTHNLKAIKLYKSVGFTKEGILKNYTFLKSKNKFIDKQIMSNLISKQYNCTNLTSTNKIYKMQILSYFMVLLSNQLKLKF